MELSEILHSTPEQRARRKAEWEERQRIFGEGRDPDREKAQDRAMKALILLKKHVDGTIQLDEPQRIAYCGIIVNRCANDMHFFCKHVLDMDLLTDITHKKWCDDHQRAIKTGKKRVMRLKPRGTYKCLQKGTRVKEIGIDNNFNVLNANLINQGDFFAPGIKVTMESGRSYICTEDHPFKTMEGWSKAKIGMRVAMLRKLPNPYIPISEPQEYLMGLLVGDGCLRKSTPRLSCADDSVLEQLRTYGFEFSKIGQTQCDFSVRKFFDKVRECGLEGTNSWNKFIPMEYEGSSHFLRGLFDADGSVSKRDNTISFVTVSERLADDVLRNLLYFGIVARKKYYEYIKTQKSPEHKAYRITIYNGFIKEYYENIGFTCEHKKQRLFDCVHGAKSFVVKNGNVDTIPGEWKKFLKPDEKRRTRYELGVRIDNRHSHSREKVLKCGEFLKNEKVIEIAKANIFWDKIKLIEEVGEIEFSAIGSSIENYITDDGMIHHNTTVYGIGTILWLWGCFSPQLRIFYTSANALLLQEISDKLNQYIGSDKNETLYSLIFGITKDTGAKNTSDVMNIKGRSGKGFSLILRTSGGSSVGIHPNVIITDDPLDQNDRDSQTTRDGKEAWFDSLTPLLVPFKDEKTGIEFESIYYIGTKWHMKDLISHIRERNEKLPPNQQWDIESESICDENGRSNYPDFISDLKIAEIRAGISDIFFACQYMNNPLPGDMQIFDLKKMSLVREEQVDLKLGEMLCVFDPSLGKASSDFPIVWWLHHHNDVITCYDCIDEKVQLSLIVHQIAAKNKQYNCRSMLYESNGVTLIEQSIKDAHARIDWKINLESIHHSSNKHERIVSIQPNVYSGHVQFMDDYKFRYPEAMNQIVFYPVYGHDDAPDCLEMGITYFKQPRFKFRRYEGML